MKYIVNHTPVWTGFPLNLSDSIVDLLFVSLKLNLQLTHLVRFLPPLLLLYFKYCLVLAGRDRKLWDKLVLYYKSMKSA